MAERGMRCIGCMDQLLILAEMFLLWDAMIDFSNSLLLTHYSLLSLTFFLRDGHIQQIVLLICQTPLHKVAAQSWNRL